MKPALYEAHPGKQIDKSSDKCMFTSL